MSEPNDRVTTNELGSLAKLQAITAALSQTRLPADVARVVATDMVRVLGADQGVIATVTDDGSALELLDHTGLRPTTTGSLSRFAIEADVPLARVVREGRAFWSSSREDTIAQLGGAPRYELATAAMACLPLRVGESRLGAVGFGYFDNHPFDDAERTLTRDLASQAALALERARLHESEQRARQRFEILYQFAQRVVVAERIEQVYEAALDAIEAALGTSRASVLVFDERGVMRFRAWRQLSEGYRRAVDGHSPWSRDAIAPTPVLVHDVALDPAMQPYLRVFRTEGIHALAFVPLVTRGRLIGKFMVYHDVPHVFSQPETELALAIANHLAGVIDRFDALGALQETLRYNEIFAGILAHDLRNPLGAVMSAAHLLLRRADVDVDKIRRPVDRILSSTERMSRMVDQLLDFTRARVGGGIAIHPRDTHLAELCQQATSELELVHPSWRLTCDARGELAGTWDADRLLQVVSNLVANAGHHGTPDAEIRIRLDGTHADRVTFEVHNAGAIPEALQPTLFDPFLATRHPRDHSRGLGLGLYIIRQIVVAHGGTIDVTSSEETGTSVVVVLPRHAA
ncbi:MAG TPA: GAF domain-containing sensor histidine kinase [Kofleriaceae bacterium]|nr:GAF domain-containing sensor histidine kinase [Kofleriaceae bacterium]